jgi:dTMP kinase
MDNKPLLVCVEGTDGSGKSTLIDGLIQYYTKQNLRIYYLHFPIYSDPLGKVIKSVLLKEQVMDISAFQCLCSSQRINWSVLEYPKLKDQYDIIIVDRYTPSAVVYSQIEGLQAEDILFNERKVIKPDMNIVLLLDPQVSMQRMSGRDEAATKYENIESMTKALELYKRLAEHVENVYFVDAEQDIETVKGIVIQLIDIGT